MKIYIINFYETVDFDITRDPQGRQILFIYKKKYWSSDALLNVLTGTPRAGGGSVIGYYSNSVDVDVGVKGGRITMMQDNI